jgi:2-phospho-L-lactate guanylyltransferase (CobY/MobA/RfbA family)
MAITHNVSLAATGSTSVTITPTRNTGTNAVLAFGLAYRGGTITSVQWGGVNLTADGSTAGAAVVTNTYYLVLGNVSAGAGTSLVVTGNANNWLYGSVCILNDVDQGTPLDTATVGIADISRTITTVTDGAALVDIFGDHGNGTGVTMGTQTNRLQIDYQNLDPAGNDDSAASSRLITKTTAGTQTMDWIFPGTLGGTLRIQAFRPSTGGAAGGSVVNSIIPNGQNIMGPGPSIMWFPNK